MHRLLLIAFSLAIIAVAISSFSAASMAADASPKTSAAPESSSADSPSWKEYKKLLENYYFLDKQKAGHISCSVSASPLQDFVDTLHRTYGSQFTIDENLHDFSITYDRIKGFSFDLPYLNISLSPGIKVTDPKQLEVGLKEINENFRFEESKMEKFIAIYLKDMIFPSPEIQKSLSLTKNGDATVVSYEGDENQHRGDIYSGTTQKQTVSSPTLNVTSILDYQLLNGKLALAHLVGETTKGSTKSDVTTSISYQDLGSAFFPAQILVDVTDPDHTQQVKPQTNEIDFKDCKTSDLSP